MRYSSLVGKTLRDAPAGTETTSAALLARAGYVRQLGAGIHSYLPLAWRSIGKIERIIRDEMESIGCHELSMPVVHPADIWQESKRWDEIGDELVRFHDRAGRDMVLAMTHEEIATDIVRREVRSYRQLPIQFFQIQTKFRDEPRPRAGLLRGREFLMKDAYSFHTDESDLQRFYDECHDAYLRAFTRCGVNVMVVESAAGIMGGSGSHEFMLEAAAGEDVLLVCPSCDYAANREVATSTISIPDEPLLPIEEIETPQLTTIEGLAAFLGVDAARTAKAVFYDVGGRLVFVVTRGDQKVNEVKLATVLGAPTLQAASDELIRSSGAVPGYASPIGVHDALVVADPSAQSRNLVAGANREGFHLRNVNLGRDYQADIVADVSVVEVGAPCPTCSAALEERRGIEVGNIFKLGTKYSAPLRANYLDDQGHEHPMIMGSYGFGVSRMLAAVAERYSDERGLRWPVSVAPFEIHLIVLGGDELVRSEADRIHGMLEADGIDVLFDDREETAGVKFADADLIGIPLRATVSARSMKSGGVEIKPRDGSQTDAIIVSVDEVVATLRAHIDRLRIDLTT